MLPSLTELSDKSLIESVREFKKVENKTIAELVLYLSEVDSRKLYRDLGFSSLFSYCNSPVEDGGLGYSEGSAYRRIQAARSLKDNPEIYELLKQGKLSLCNVAEISKVIKPENRLELLDLAQGKPKAEVQRIAVQFQDAVSPVKLREKVVARKVKVSSSGSLFPSPDSPKAEVIEAVQLTFTAEVDQEFLDLLKEAKELVGHVPSAEVIKRTLREFVRKRKTVPRNVDTKPPEAIKQETKQESKPKAPSRYIPKAVRYKVKEESQNRCCFVTEDGRRCSEKFGLQFDHINPFALGGGNEIENLRLMCPAHNQLLAERTFGREKIESNFHR